MFSDVFRLNLCRPCRHSKFNQPTNQTNKQKNKQTYVLFRFFFIISLSRFTFFPLSKPFKQKQIDLREKRTHAHKFSLTCKHYFIHHHPPHIFSIAIYDGQNGILIGFTEILHFNDEDTMTRTDGSIVMALGMDDNSFAYRNTFSRQTAVLVTN